MGKSEIEKLCERIGLPLEFKVDQSIKLYAKLPESAYEKKAQFVKNLLIKL
jgi:hypothetical protein